MAPEPMTNEQFSGLPLADQLAYIEAGGRVPQDPRSAGPRPSVAMPAPLRPGTPTTQISVRLPEHLVALFDSIAADNGGTRTDLIREAMVRFLRQEMGAAAAGPTPAEIHAALSLLRTAALRLAA